MKGALTLALAGVAALTGLESSYREGWLGEALAPSHGAPLALAGDEMGNPVMAAPIRAPRLICYRRGKAPLYAYQEDDFPEGLCAVITGEAPTTDEQSAIAEESN